MTSDVQRLAVEHYPCPYCGVPAGRWCVVARGRTAGARVTWIHQGRVGALEQAWSDGHREGRRTARASTAHALEAASRGDVWAVRDGVPRLPADTVAAITRWLERVRW